MKKEVLIIFRNLLSMLSPTYKKYGKFKPSPLEVADFSIKPSYVYKKGESPLSLARFGEKTYKR